MIDSLTAPVEGIAGQPVRIAWTISNQGDTLTTEPAWTDRIYLSTNYSLDGSDIPVGSRVRQESLTIGESYQDSLDIILPPFATGNYILIFKTDDGNVMYEHEGEGNNIFTTQLLIIQADPSDLVVTDIVSPDTIVAGEAVTIEWNLRNTGENMANGITGEAVFLSADSLLDQTDIRLGVVENSIRLAPGGETQRIFEAFADNLSMGNYYLFVQADLKNNIHETDEQNNIALSPAQITVTVPTLNLGETYPDSLSSSQRKYYRITVPDSLAGETLLVSLAGAEQAVNTLYLRHGAVPTPVNYDFKYDRPVSGTQEVVVPELLAGDYYVLVTGQDQGNPDQAIAITTRIIPFELLMVDASQGGNSGMVTVKLEGAKFTSGMNITLEDVALGTIMATRYELKNSLLLYATFDLRGAATGLFDVKLEKTDGSTASLPEGFEVVTGLIKGLTIQSGGGNNQGQPGTKGFVCCDRELDFSGVTTIGDYLPANTRINRIVSMTFYVENSSNVDIPVPARYLISLEGAPLGFSVAELEENKQEVYLLFREEDGPEHILRPGATGTVTLYTKAVTRLRFQMIE